MAHVQAVIVPSRAAEQQLKAVLPHLPTTHVIEPVVKRLGLQVKPEMDQLIVLIPGNLSINKGYLELRKLSINVMIMAFRSSSAFW